MSFDTFHVSSQIYYTTYLDVVKDLPEVTEELPKGKEVERGMCGLTWKRQAGTQINRGPVFLVPSGKRETSETAEDLAFVSG